MRSASPRRSRPREERFFETLANGMEILDAALAGDARVLPGDVAFKLHDTYGFPLDLSADVCRERGVVVDEAGFNAAMDKQRRPAAPPAGSGWDRAVEYAGAGNTFTGYEHLEEQAGVVALYHEGAPVQALQEGQSGIVVLDTTPFYAESGGQVGDQGVLTAEGVRVRRRRHAEDQGRRCTATTARRRRARSRSATRSRPRVDGARRAATMRNHSVTHLMHKALREVLGGHVQQKGSLVDADKTRFDFAHNAPVTHEQILEIEKRVNAEILANAPTQARVMDMESAQKTGAVMLFGEKYGETVRVLDIGSSREPVRRHARCAHRRHRPVQDRRRGAAWRPACAAWKP